MDGRRVPHRGATGHERLASEASRLRRREMPNSVAGFCLQRENLASYLILAARQADDDQFTAACFYELGRRIDGHSVMEIGNRFLPRYFACFRVQGHDGIVKPADENFAVPKSHAVVVPAAAEKELRELRLVVEAGKLPYHLSRGGIQGEYVVVTVSDE